MIEFGKNLRNAREAKGYTVSQIADMTHLKTSVVEGLENEDFSMIAAPIYGRGFVKLYCEAVGLDAKPFVDEFMAISNGNREAAIKERPVAPPPAVPPPAAPPPAAKAAPEPSLFERNLQPPPEPVAPVPPRVQPSIPRAAEQPTLSRYAAPAREGSAPAPVGHLNPRIIVLAGCVLALLVVLVLGIRSLYHATTSDAAEQPAVPAEATPPAEVRVQTPAEEPATPAPAPEAEAERVARTPQKIPSLYID